MENHLRTELVLEALEMALWQRQPTEVIHHSDQGTQYTSIAFGVRCKRAKVVRPSTGSTGDCYDNAMCESFFASLECELLDRNVLSQSHAEARLARLRLHRELLQPANADTLHSATRARSSSSKKHARPGAPTVSVGPWCWNRDRTPIS